MEKLGVLVVSKCLSAPAMVDALLRSDTYAPELYVVQKQANPYLTARARAHAEVPDMGLDDIERFARRHAKRISFGLTDTEDFVCDGGRDLLEKAGVEMLCVSKQYAVERSKAGQRLLFDRVFSGANPRFRVFDPRGPGGARAAREAFRAFLKDLREPVLKPDAPARGAGVGVWGADFSTDEGALAFFEGLLAKGRVVVEEKVLGEESSFHAFSDGRHFVAAPMTRDYKRSEDGNRGRLTGGMGSYRAPTYRLPFVAEADWERLASAEERAFRRWKGRGTEPGLKGVVLYDAIMHTGGGGFRVLERNSRGGNTESMNLYATMQDDFAEVCLRMREGTLTGIRFSREAAVVTCAVPPGYGGVGSPPRSPLGVDLGRAEERAEKSGGALRVFPMDVKSSAGRCYVGGSRSVAFMGVAPTLELAREESQKGCAALAGPFRWRRDVASKADVAASRARLRALSSA